MNILFTIAAASSPFHSVFFVLFLAFLIAAIIWLLLWLFSDGYEGGGVSAKSSTSGSADPDAGAASVTGVTSESGDSGETPAEDESTPETEEETAAGDGTAGEEEEEESFEAATAEEAANLFSTELESGEVTQDPVYGIIYREAPAEVDDLKEIKGVAKVLEGKLNGIGVYRFKQVAVWTDEACAEFSKMLTFKNRIYTDNWLAQARGFHEEKYGEKLD